MVHLNKARSNLSQFLGESGQKLTTQTARGLSWRGYSPRLFKNLETLEFSVKGPEAPVGRGAMAQPTAKNGTGFAPSTRTWSGNPRTRTTERRPRTTLARQPRAPTQRPPWGDRMFTVALPPRHVHDALAVPLRDQPVGRPGVTV